MAPASVRSSPHSSPVYAIFFVSGMASLMCEVVWFEQLGLVLGSSTFSASVVVACFFGGMSLGSLTIGRLADRWERPLRRYAALELALAFASAGSTLMLARWPSWIGWFRPLMSLDAATALPAKVAVALLVLLLPTTLMGATLPVLARHLVRQRSELAERIGFLYGLNTLGAAVGCSLVGWVLIEAVGSIASALVASALYLGIAATAFTLSADGAPMPADQGRAEPAGGAGTLAAAALIGVFGASGFVAIGYEVLWFRMLAFFTQHGVHAFSTLLSTYLLGIVLGAVVCATYVAPRKELHLVNFARLQLGVAAAALVSVAMLGLSRPLLALLADRTPLGEEGGLVVLALAVLLLPTTLLGVAFPLASELAVPKLSRLGARVGLLFALNTFGGVLGSFFAGFVLLPAIGVQASFQVLIACNLALFGVLLATQPGLVAHRRQLGLQAAGAVVFLVGATLFLGPGHVRRSLGSIGGESTCTGSGSAEDVNSACEVLDYRENEDATFVVLQHTEPHGVVYQQVLVNGATHATNGPAHRRSRAAMGHLPMLLHPAPHEVAVVQVGTGTTAGAVSLHPEARRVWAVDPTDAMFQFAPYFAPINQRFYDSPLVRRVVSDGRHFLQVADERFDVLTFEPPASAAGRELHTREFYRLARARLAAGGVLTQWMPFAQGDLAAARSQVRTALDVFPHGALWLPGGGYDGVLVLTDQVLRIDPVTLARRAHEGAVAVDLAAIGLEDEYAVLATFVSADEALAAWAAGAPVLTDDRPSRAAASGVPFTHASLEPYRVSVEDLLTRPVDAAPLTAAREARLRSWEHEDLATRLGSAGAPDRAGRASAGHAQAGRTAALRPR